MAYSDPNFSFDPKKEFGFDPTQKNISDNRYPADVNQNPFVPTCSDQSNQVKEIHRQQISEYANLYGQTISYQPVKYNFNTHNFLYGEDMISGYQYSRKMKAIIDFSSYTTFLTKFGIMSDSDITIYIPIREFERVWGPSKGVTYPLAGDLFLIDDEACDRPLGQSPMVFEVTDKEDKIKPVDFMGGHYVWKLVAKRFDYSYQPNAPEERFLDDESSDNKQFGRLPGGENPPDMSSTGDDVDVFAKKEFDNKESSTYGKYL
jgi:hypothetical protein